MGDSFPDTDGAETLNYLRSIIIQALLHLLALLKTMDN